MNTFIRNHFKRIASSVLVAAFAVAALPAVASAQAAPGEEIQGTVQSINGTWNITVLDNNGYLDNVGLHQGTIINPTGLTLAPGMSVTIEGYTDGNIFQANEIDTPYQYSGALPVPVYYGPGYWYPGYAYGYGPSFSLVLGFGGSGYFVERHPWIGHWWEPTPIHGFVGYRYPEGRAVVAPRTGFARPEVRSYARPEARTYAAPQYRSTYTSGAARTYSRPSYSGGAARSYARPSSSGGRSGGAARSSGGHDRH